MAYLSCIYSTHTAPLQSVTGKPPYHKKPLRLHVPDLQYHELQGKKKPTLGYATQFNKVPYKTTYLVTHNKLGSLQNQFLLQFPFL